MMEQFELTFTGLAYPGRAFGRDPNGRMIFAPFALPEERAWIEIVESHKRWAQGRILEILKPSPHRIPARCRHYTQCGGCYYQHIPYANQLEVKYDIVRSQLKRIAGMESPPVSATVPSPSHWNYRNHIQFSLDPEGQLGFHAPQSELVVPITECHLPDAHLTDLWPRLELIEIPGLDRVSLRSGSDESRMVILHSEMASDVELEIDIPSSVV